MQSAAACRHRSCKPSGRARSVERVVLYGSRARGDAGPDSDYDAAVFLREMDEGARNCIGWLT